MVRIISGSLGELIGPGVDDWMAVDVGDAGHNAFLEFVLCSASSGRRLHGRSREMVGDPAGMGTH